MKTLITGASGYIGSYLIKEMHIRGSEYICSTRSDFDYTNYESIKRYFDTNKIDKVIHLASIMDNQNTSGLFEINILGLYNLLRVCGDNKISHFTFASGNNVYGLYQEKIYNELDYTQPDDKNLYGFSKYVGELVINDYCNNYGIKFANVRIADVYGPNQKHGNLMKAIVDNVKNENPLSLYGEGKRTRDYIYIKDVIDGLLFISENDLIGNYNLSTGVGTNVKKILETVNDIFSGDLKINEISVLNEDTSFVVLDNKKLLNEGFNIKYTLKDGLIEIFKEDKNR